MFKPGEIWNDTDGNRIEAHAGSVHYFNDRYYWYGENKKGCGDVRRGSTKPRQAGINCYSSKNLVDWKFEGNVIPVSKDPDHDLYFNNVVDRPHVLYNKNTKKYVMWLKVVHGIFKYQQRTGIATADHPTGPFTYHHSFLPCGLGSGDANFLVEDRNTQHPVDGMMTKEDPDFLEDAPKAYWIFSNPHRSIVVTDLSADYMECTGMYSHHLARPGSPFGREAPVALYHNWKYHVITSGTSGFEANGPLYSTADILHGDWQDHDNPCTGPNAENTFDAQFASVFELHDKPGCFIGIADRWNPEDMEDTRHVWLPFTFENNRLVIKWMDEWDLSVFDERD